jgi:hypothetical protein
MLPSFCQTRLDGNETLDRERKMRYRQITPENTKFVPLAFEGPASCPCAGEPGVRIKGLSTGLASTGFPLHLFFVGDPRRGSRESFCFRMLPQIANCPR